MENTENKQVAVLTDFDGNSTNDFDRVYTLHNDDWSEHFYLCDNEGAFDKLLGNIKKESTNKGVVMGIVGIVSGMVISKIAPIVGRKIKQIWDNRKQKSIKG